MANSLLCKSSLSSNGWLSSPGAIGLRSCEYTALRWMSDLNSCRLPNSYQNYLGLSPVKTMLRFIPMFVSGAVCNFIVALVVGRISGSILLGTRNSDPPSLGIHSDRF